MNDTNAFSGLDAQVVERLRGVSTATLTMALIKRGVRTSWLRGPVPLDPIAGRIVGPAFTIRFVPGREDLSGPESYARSPSFRDAIEAAPAGSVVVIDGCGNPCGATLGDILVARLARRGVVAAVTDAPVRDADEIRAVGLPVLRTLRTVRPATGQGGGKRSRAVSAERRCCGGLRGMDRRRRALASSVR